MAHQKIEASAENISAAALLSQYSPDMIYKNWTFLDKHDKDEIVLDRFQLVHTLSLTGRLRCAVMSTFTLNLAFLCEVMPLLFGPDATVPTLLLHGNNQRLKLAESKRKYSWKASGEARSSIVGPLLRLVEVMPFHDFKSAKGVHHPKYMLLFLKDPEEMLFLISTANLAKPWPLDCSWFQVFKAREAETAETSTEFGSTLDDFLVQQGEAIYKLSQREPTADFTPPSYRDTPRHWLEDNVGFTKPLDQLYDFSTARAALITSVPLDGIKRDDARFERYGHLRIAAALRAAGKRSHHVVIQPTSIGNFFDDAYIRQLEDSYDVPELKVLWPSLPFVVEAVKRRESKQTEADLLDDDEVNKIDLKILADAEGSEKFKMQRRACPLHFPPEFYARLGHDVRSSFAQYIPVSTCSHLVPHCKFVLSASEDKTRLDWLLLSSMCLSRGACGDIQDDGKYRIRNYEMGVLFLDEPPPIDALPFQLDPPALLQHDNAGTLKASFLPFLDTSGASSIRDFFDDEDLLPRARRDLAILDGSSLPHSTKRQFSVTSDVSREKVGFATKRACLTPVPLVTFHNPTLDQQRPKPPQQKGLHMVLDLSSPSKSQVDDLDAWSITPSSTPLS